MLKLYIGILEKQDYCGDVLNFKTFTKSYRLKQRFKSEKKDIMIFKDVHEPIITRTMLCELIEKIEVFPAEKVNGLSVQRLNIYYRCIGSFELDELEPELEWNILIETRPGVILTDTVE